MRLGRREAGGSGARGGAGKFPMQLDNCFANTRRAAARIPAVNIVGERKNRDETRSRRERIRNAMWSTLCFILHKRLTCRLGAFVGRHFHAADRANCAGVCSSLCVWGMSEKLEIVLGLFF